MAETRPRLSFMSESHTLSDLPRGREDVVFRQLADEWVLYDPGSNQIHVLNLSAALVWTACTGELTVDQIVDEVRSSYPDDPERDLVQRDVLEALEHLAEEGLLA